MIYDISIVAYLSTCIQVRDVVLFCILTEQEQIEDAFDRLSAFHPGC